MTIMTALRMCVNSRFPEKVDIFLKKLTVVFLKWLTFS